MKRILKLFLKQSKEDPFRYNSGITTRPIEAWKKNIFAIIAGIGLGLYAGQYFPDVFYHQVEPYLPQIQQLKQLSPKLQDRAPNPLYPKSLFDYPQDALHPGYGFRQPEVKEQDFEILNETTKQKQKFKIIKVQREEDNI